MSNLKPTVLIYATNQDWGGSEHLWFETVPFLLQNGYCIHVLCKRDLLDIDKVTKLSKSCKIVFIKKNLYIVKLFFRIIRKIFGINIELDFRIKYIKSVQPDFVLVNQGLNFDAYDLLDWLSANNIKYGVLSHAVDPRIVFNPTIVKALQKGFAKASFNGFVSESNILQTSKSIGMEIPLSKVFRNPVNRPCNSKPISFPNTDKGFNMAFVGRLDFRVKGQDLLLKVLQQSHWKDRELFVRFYGDGPDKDNLNHLLSEYSIERHEYLGYRVIEEIWAENHALILTSHFEGLPIVIIEAGLHARVCVVTNVSGNAELISDNVDGFVAVADSFEAIDEALERAWGRRCDWQQMGLDFRAKLLDVIPDKPGQILAETILEQVYR